MLQTRIDPAGATISVTGALMLTAILLRGRPDTAMPSGPTTKICGGTCASGLLIPLVCRRTAAHRSPGQR